jgi:hypothetical protein
VIHTMKSIHQTHSWTVRAVILVLLSTMFAFAIYPLNEVYAGPLTSENGRVVQVDLESHPKISQYAHINSSQSGFGKNACGLVSAAAAVGGKNWTPLVGVIAKAAGTNYGNNTGIQPSKYVAALQQVFGGENVVAMNSSSLQTLHQELQAGNIVIVDVKVNQTYQVPSGVTPNYAHFARVLGMDMDKQEVYVENTLRGAPYWTVSFEHFLKAWERPETTASLIPDWRHAEDVTRWAVILKKEMVTDYQAANNL